MSGPLLWREYLMSAHVAQIIQGAYVLRHGKSLESSGHRDRSWRYWRSSECSVTNAGASTHASSFWKFCFPCPTTSAA